MTKHIVTHSGQAHRDELLTIGLAFAVEGVVPIYRREPTQEELADPQILVLDVGGKHEPALSNFDHHQRGRDEKPECALSLYAQDKGLEEVLNLQKWYGPLIQMDVRGPFATAKELGLSRFPFELMGPIEGQILMAFQNATEVLPGSIISNVLDLIGTGMLTSAKEYAEKTMLLAEKVKVVEIKGLQALIFETTDTEGSQDIRDRKYPDAAISLAWDDRGNGWTLYRFNDHPAVDFSALEGDTKILFAHKGGFIAKTHERLELDELFALVARAVQ